MSCGTRRAGSASRCIASESRSRPAATSKRARRDARYAALEPCGASCTATAVLVAHTADDQAETVLLNLLRGSGASGLAGMPTRRGHMVRPLLGARRTDVHDGLHRERVRTGGRPVERGSDPSAELGPPRRAPGVERRRAPRSGPVLNRQAECCGPKPTSSTSWLTSCCWRPEVTSRRSAPWPAPIRHWLVERYGAGSACRRRPWRRSNACSQWRAVSAGPRSSRGGAGCGGRPECCIRRYRVRP